MIVLIMNESKDLDTGAVEMGRVVGEMFTTLAAVIDLIRKQPGFDEPRFQSGIQELLKVGEVSDFQRSMLKTFVNNSESDGQDPTPSQ